MGGGIREGVGLGRLGQAVPALVVAADAEAVALTRGEGLPHGHALVHLVGTTHHAPVDAASKDTHAQGARAAGDLQGTDGRSGGGGGGEQRENSVHSWRVQG